MASGTVLVTGASGGIGWELAKLFAADGFDVALVGRYPARLEELAQELEERSAVRAYVISKDLGVDGAARRVVSALAEQGAHADVLVNSAGFTQFGPVAESSPHRMDELMHVNMVALTSLTRLVLPGMLERGWGRIVNLASNAAFQPGPLMAAYYASKAYVLSFSIALAEELRGTGVRVTALCPGPTRSGFQAAGGIEGSKLVADRSLSSAAEVAEWGYRAVKRGKPFAVEGARWQAFAFGTRFLPRTLAARIVRRAQERV